MTHHVTKHHSDHDATDEQHHTGGQQPDSGLTEEYQCTDEELAGAGFQLLEPWDMPEHESEFVTDPCGDRPLTRAGAGLGELVEIRDIDPRPGRPY
jgi:hypothetical protein